MSFAELLIIALVVIIGLMTLFDIGGKSS